jgi:hypothetical protein
MDADRFDALTRSLASAALSRRRLLTGMAGSAVGAVAATLGFADASASHYACVHIGKRCGNSDQCCSGVCKRKRCRVHDKGGCSLSDNFCAGGKDNRCKPGCICNNTTGNAPHCGGSAFCPAVECQRDADCGEPGAACIPPVNCQGCGNPATQNFCQLPCTT